MEQSGVSNEIILLRSQEVKRNGGEACKQLRAFKKNKAGVMVSIVGFGRPKFKSGGAAKPASTSSTGVCPTCGK